MKRLIVSSLFILGLVTASYAAVPVPTDKQNVQIGDPRWGGASTCVIDQTTGTNDLLCATGKGVIFGVLVSSSAGASSAYITFRDTATANHTSTVLGAVAPGNSAASPLTQFPLSIKFVNGLNATMGSSAGKLETWTILYRLQSDQN